MKGKSLGKFGVGPDWDETKTRPRGSPTKPWSPTTSSGGVFPGPGVVPVSVHLFPLGLSVPHQPLTSVLSSFLPSLTLRFSKVGGQRGPPRGRVRGPSGLGRIEGSTRGSPTIPQSPKVPPEGVLPGPGVTLRIRQLFPRSLRPPPTLPPLLFTPFHPSPTLRFSEVGSQRGPSGVRFGVGPVWDKSKVRPHGSPTIP